MTSTAGSLGTGNRGVDTATADSSRRSGRHGQCLGRASPSPAPPGGQNPNAALLLNPFQRERDLHLTFNLASSELHAYLAGMVDARGSFRFQVQTSSGPAPSSYVGEVEYKFKRIVKLCFEVRLPAH